MNNEIKDNEWDERKFGAEEEFVGVVSKVESEKIDSILGLKAINLKISEDLYSNLMGMSESEKIPLVVLIRNILSDFVSKN